MEDQHDMTTTKANISEEQLLAARVRLPQHVVFRAFPSETVVLNLETGKYHSVNPSGGHFLEVLEQSRSVGEAIKTLQDTFSDQGPGDVHAHVRQFCFDLVARGLIEVVEPK